MQKERPNQAHQPILTNKPETIRRTNQNATKQTCAEVLLIKSTQHAAERTYHIDESNSSQTDTGLYDLQPLPYSR